MPLSPPWSSGPQICPLRFDLELPSTQAARGPPRTPPASTTHRLSLAGSVHGTTDHLISQTSQMDSVPSHPPSPRPSTSPSRPPPPQFCPLPRPPGLCALALASMESLIHPQPESPSEPKSSHTPWCSGAQTLERPLPVCGIVRAHLTLSPCS